MSALILAAGLIALAFELQNVLSWWRGRVLEAASVATSDDYTIIVPLYGHPRYFAAGREALAPYAANTMVALDVGSGPLMADYACELEAGGFQVARLELESPNPASLVTAALDHVTTTAVLRLDADTTLGPDLPAHVASFLSSGADVASVKVHASNRRKLVCRLQHLEYRIAMLARHFRPWLTSGACLIARTSSLRVIYAHHSHWTPGEDIETGRAALALRMKIRHCDMVAFTEVPDSWRALVRQRRLWWAGNFRHAVVNIDRNLIHMPVMTAYWTMLIWTSFELKWWSVLAGGTWLSMLPALYLGYLLITALANVRVASPLMLLFPFYALVQSMVLPALGALTYLRLATSRRRLGRYRFGYRRRAVLVATAPGGSPGTMRDLL